MDILNNVQQTSLVSVVMPAYNAEKTIAGAVLSLKSQTYSNWELIIVDDKSTDATIEVVEKLSQLDSRIRLIKRTENSGGCRIPRFEAVLAALGDYICYLDADDVLEATYIEKVIERIKETGADVVLTRLVLKRDGNNFASIPEESFDMQRLLSGEDACRMTLGKWEISVSGALSTSLYYKSFVEEALTNSSPLCFMDEVDYRKFLYYAKKVAFSDAIYYYCENGNSACHSLNEKQLKSKIDAITEIEKVLAEKQYFSCDDFVPIKKNVLFDALRGGLWPIVENLYTEIHANLIKAGIPYKIHFPQTGCISMALRGYPRLARLLYYINM